jgi:hypothetical protein
MSALSVLWRALTRLSPHPNPPPLAGEGMGGGRWVQASQLALSGLFGTLLSTAALAEMSAEPVALLEGLDKITARVSKFDARIDAPVRFGTLLIRVRDCEKSPPEDPPESAAFVEIDEMRPGDSTARRVFSGWMFASSPALSALEHPVYDVTLLDCKAASGSPRNASGNAAGKEAR